MMPKQTQTASEPPIFEPHAIAIYGESSDIDRMLSAPRSAFSFARHYGHALSRGYMPVAPRRGLRPLNVVPGPALHISFCLTC